MLKNDINTPLLVTITTISSLLLVIVLLGVHAWYLFEVDTQTKQTWKGVTYKQVYELKQEQRTALAAPPRWADRDQGTVKIPIEQAIDLVASNGGRLPKAK